LTERMIQMTDKKLSIGIGSELFGIEGIRESYNQAKQAMGFADNSSIVSYSEDWKIERLTHSISHHEYKIICSDYEEKLRHLGADYIYTIDVFMAYNFSMKETAKKLHIHRNTLIYRLEQITKKVGLDPRLFEDVFLLKVIRS